MKINELKAAYKWGKELIEESKKEGREIPVRTYERQLELADQIIDIICSLEAYDIDAKSIKEIAKQNETTVADVIEAMILCWSDNGGEEYL